MKKYFKIIDANYKDIYGNVYHKGLNKLPTHIDLYDDKCICITDVKYIFSYLDYGPLLIEAAIPEDATVLEKDNGTGVYLEYTPVYAVDKLWIEKIYRINTNTVKMLINQGANIRADDYHLFRYALLHNYDLWNYLNKEYKEYSGLVLKKFYL